MKLIRLSLVCSLLLLVAVPMFAIPCRSCDGPVYPYCISNPDGGTRCQIGVDYCITQQSTFCTGFSDQASVQTSMLSEWQVASIEVKRPEGTKVVTAQPVVADASPLQK